MERRRRWTRRQVVRAAGGAALGLTGVDVFGRETRAAPGVRTVEIALGGPQINEGLVTIAVGQHMGYYRAEGLEVSLIPTGGSNQAVQEVAAAKIPVAFPSPDPVILGYQPDVGLRLKWFYTAYQGFIYDIRTPAGSPLRSVKDLAGKTIGVVNLASAAVPAVKGMLHENGVDPRTVSFVGIGVGAQAAGAIRAGRVDAVAVWDTIYAELDNEGINLNPRFVSPTLRSLFSNGLAVLPATLQSDRAMLVGLCRAMAKGTVWTFANPEQAVRIFWRVYPQSKPVGMGEEDALRRSLHVLKARLVNMSLSWVPIKKWGWNEPARWTAYETFLYEQGILKTRVNVAQLFTNALVVDANTFDTRAIEQQARTYVLR